MLFRKLGVRIPNFMYASSFHAVTRLSRYCGNTTIYGNWLASLITQILQQDVLSNADARRATIRISECVKYLNKKVLPLGEVQHVGMSKL
jgi:hypothetical protein